MAGKAKRRERIATAILASLVGSERAYDATKHPQMALSAADDLMALLDGAEQKQAPAAPEPAKSKKHRRKNLDEVD